MIVATCNCVNRKELYFANIITKIHVYFLYNYLKTSGNYTYHLLQQLAALHFVFIGLV
jgi:hypothetical protein